MAKLFTVIIAVLLLSVSYKIEGETETPIKTISIEDMQDLDDIYTYEKGKSAFLIGNNDVLHFSTEAIFKSYLEGFWDMEHFNYLADILYGRYMIVTGEINKVHNGDIFDEYYITFRYEQIRDDQLGRFMSINCFFEANSEQEKLNNYKAGDKVTVIGYSSPKSNAIYGPMLYDCFFIS